MYTVLDDNFSDNEKLYRAIRPRDAFWDSEKNKPTSGAFKDKNGLSVDRQGYRDNEKAVKGLLSTQDSNSIIVSISVGDCKGIPVLPVYRPQGDNCFHSEIHDSKEKVRLSNSHARIMVEKISIEHN